MMRKLLISLSISALALMPLASSAALPSTGTLVKGSGSAVYWYSANGKRYVFPNEKTYKTWFADFSGVVTISDAELASLMIGGNVTYKPGVKMAKITTDPKTYAIDAGGTLRWLKSESVATGLYGSNWNTKVEDVPDAFFVNYRVGADVDSVNQFSPSSATTAAMSIDVDLAARSTPPPQQPPPTPPPTVVINPDIPDVEGTVDAGLVVAGHSSVVLSRFRLTASLEELKLVKVRVSLQNAASARDIKRLSLYDGHALVGGPVAVDASGNADFSNVNFITPRNDSNTLTIAAELNTISQGAQSGDDVGVLLHVPASDDGTYEARGTSSGTVLKSGSTGDMLGNSKLVRKTILSVANLQLPTTVLNDGDINASRFSLSAASDEQASVKKLTFNVSKSTGIVISAPVLRDVSTSQDIASSATLSNCGAGFGTCTVQLAMTDELVVGAGASRSFQLKLNVAGSAASTSIQTSLFGDAVAAKGQLSNSGNGIAGNTSYSLIWSDNSSIPHNSADAGSNDWLSGIYVKNLPTDVQTLSRN